MFDIVPCGIQMKIMWKDTLTNSEEADEMLQNYLMHHCMKQNAAGPALFAQINSLEQLKYIE